MDHKACAAELFAQGRNCAQAVFCAFSDITGLNDSASIRLSASFGGGMGRLQEVCGALTGAFLVLGWLYAPENPSDKEAKQLHYARIRALAESFCSEFGAIRCRELLNGALPGGHGRPCAAYVTAAASLLEQFIAAHPPEKHICG